MTGLRHLAAAIVAAWVTLASSATAELTADAQLAAGRCAERATMVRGLSGRFGEAQRFRGVAGGALVELWLSPAGSWSVLASWPGGAACLQFAGDAGEILPSPPAGVEH